MEHSRILTHLTNSKTSLWPGPSWPSFSQKARENGLVTPSSLLSFVFVVIFLFVVALQIEDKVGYWWDLSGTGT